MAIRTARRLALAALLGLAALPTLAADEPGVWWEQTAEASMKGMALPATTSRVCVPKSGMKEPPGTGQSDCRMTDLRREGNRTTWKVECGGADPMSGEGEMVGSKESYDGKMTMRSGAMGEMQVKMKGKLVGGDCDAGALKRQVEAAVKQNEQQAQAIQKQQEQSLEETCAKAVEEVQLRLFGPPTSFCKKPEQVAALCARLGTRAGLLRYRRATQGDPEGPRLAKEVCKNDPEAGRPALCAQAAGEAKGAATSSEVLEFLGDACPDEAQALAKKECAGRSYTGMPRGFRAICVKYAQGELAKDKPAPGAASNPVTDAAADVGKGVGKGMKDEVKSEAVGQGKKLIKGLFGK